jgi:hypothetical protein
MEFATCWAIFSTIDLPPLFIVGVIVFDATLNLKAGVRAVVKKQDHRITEN